MATVEEFRTALRELSVEDVVDQFVLSADAFALDRKSVNYIQSAVASGYGMPIESVEIVITGSAKLGFSTSRKFKDGNEIAPQYRAFSAQSDIDVAVISPDLFDRLWLELTTFSHRGNTFPWKSNRLGDYLICGWLRPDHFPSSEHLYLCDNWFEIFRKLSSNSMFDRHRVSGGIFYSKKHLALYISRSVKDCMDQEEIQ